jgi:23S rRNA (uracil1939-C5)-methyltransferase
VQDAVSDAQTNAGLNGVDNCEFILGDLKDLLRNSSSFADSHSSPHVVVTDPPRAGMHPSVVKKLLTLEPPRIVYVSCNPATLMEKYRLLQVQPVDLFPHTPHVEAVAVLEKR